MRMTDSVVQYILSLLEEEHGSAEFRRNELAETMGCVPSQISYVISSRFTPEQGYLVESRRGGGGYVRIIRIQRANDESSLSVLLRRIGRSIDEDSANAIISQLLESKIITRNEALLMQYLLGQTKEPRRRAYLINHFLEQFRTTLYRQTMFAEFELWCSEQIRKGEALTAEALCAKYADLNRQYYGEDIEPDPEIALEWARIPHFYYNFYVYQYATGFASAIALSQRILREGKPAVDDYIRFLSGGCSTDPVSLLRGAGVDISTPAPISSALKMFDQLIGEMEELTAK